MPPKMKQEIQRRDNITQQFQRFKEFVEKLQNEPALISQLAIRREKAEACWADFDTVQTLIEVNVSNDPSEAQKRVEFETMYFETMALAEGFQASQNTNNSQFEETTNLNVTNSVTATTKCRLPTINIPDFSGKFEEWQPFKELFESMIHNNNSLTDIQRFHYLHSCLKGEALQSIQSLQLTNQNYIVAWELLTERFENKRLIVQGHIQALFALPRVEKESSTALRRLLDQTLRHLRALKALKMPTDSWDALIIHLVTSKLDPTTARDWENKAANKEPPSLKELTDFLVQRCQMLEALGSNHLANRNPRFYPKSDNIALKKTAVHLASNKSTCKVCYKAHKLYQCELFKSKSIPERIQEVKKLGLCLNCLRENHKVADCTSGTCKRCDQRHNTLLHLDSTSSPSASSKGGESPPETPSTSLSAIGMHIEDASHQLQSQHGTVMLSTAIIQILDSFGVPHSCRALLDSGSQSNFISKRLASRLKLPSAQGLTSISGIGGTDLGSYSSVHATIKSRINSFSRNVTFTVIPEISQNIPTVPIHIADWKIPKAIELADPDFNISSPIDILIGAELFYDLLCIGQVRLTGGNPVLQKTVFGWIVSGRLNTPSELDTTKRCHLSQNAAVQSQLEKFWKIEEGALESSFSLSHDECELHFIDSFQKTDGRFMVRLPVKDNVKELGESRDIAMQRLLQVERRLTKNPTLRDEYIRFMQEYESLGHMEMVNEEVKEHPHCYLPHHCVIKQDSTTSKVRVVFDASCPTTSGLSLNDTLRVGPVVQDDLFALITRFRLHSVAMSADIEKMYRQILVHPEDRDLQRILWRADPAKPIQAYHLNAVTYGTACAPFLATRSLLQVAKDIENTHPKISQIISRDFYVDDLLTGCSTTAEASKLKEEITEILKNNGFVLRKWCSNTPSLMASSSINSNEESQLINDHSTKSLGIRWHYKDDEFAIAVTPPPVKHPTKRSLLSSISKIFDPLGLVAPVTIRAKLLLQELWKLNLKWDESLPSSLHSMWLQLQQGFGPLSELRIPRRATEDHSATLQLQGFCDASEKAYGACIYLVGSTESKTWSNLLCAKSRVAPLRKETLPRLELCAAVLLAQLLHRVTMATNLPIKDAVLWSDSTIVLAWLKAPANRWKTFVANRVAMIQQLTKGASWRHIKGETNPADLITRGLNPNQLQQSALWWHGPPECLNYSHQDVDVPSLPLADIPEARPAEVIALTSSVATDLISKYSSLPTLLRIVAYCLRFICNCKKNVSQRSVGSLTTREVDQAMRTLVRSSQRETFPMEYQALVNGKPISKGSPLKGLCPFIDDENIIRVGGRLAEGNLPNDQKFPMILPGRHTLTKLIARQEHRRLLHAGPQLLLSQLRLRFWPLNGRKLVTQTVHNCITCQRANPKWAQQLMGNLPAKRIEPSRAFLHSGVDYCGPILIRQSRRRNAPLVKAYIAVFICLATKATHLELVGDMTSESFIGALKRFISRRGRCVELWSDNATTFSGAFRELKELADLFSSAQHEKKLLGFTQQEGIQWRFIPPRSPNMGGLWEAAVKSAKFHLKRTVGQAHLTYEELYTIIAQAEACLNSRPISAMSDDPNDITPLTPGHFLVGEPLTAIPEPDVSHIPMNRLSRWQYVQRLTTQFWNRWSREYVSQLQVRNKWRSPHPSVKVGTLVLIKDENQAPLCWPMGRITQVFPGPDGQVRVCNVKTPHGTFKRSIRTLCPLRLEQSSSD